MSLRTKRNLPTILLLAAFIFSLVIFLGSQPVIAYKLNAVNPANSVTEGLSSRIMQRINQQIKPASKETYGSTQTGMIGRDFYGMESRALGGTPWPLHLLSG